AAGGARRGAEARHPPGAAPRDDPGGGPRAGGRPPLADAEPERVAVRGRGRSDARHAHLPARGPGAPRPAWGAGAVHPARPGRARRDGQRRAGARSPRVTTPRDFMGWTWLGPPSRWRPSVTSRRAPRAEGRRPTPRGPE